MIHLKRLFVGILGIMLALSPVILIGGLIYIFVSNDMEAIKITSLFLFLVGVLSAAYLLGKDILK